MDFNKKVYKKLYWAVGTKPVVPLSKDNGYSKTQANGLNKSSNTADTK